MRSLINILILISLACPNLHSDNWGIHQNNYQFNKDSFYVRYRDYVNLDKTHFTLSKKFFEHFGIIDEHISGRRTHKNFNATNIARIGF